MRPSKWNCATVLALLLIRQASGFDWIIRVREVRPANVRALRSSRSRPFWEDVLRESLFRSLWSSPEAKRELYKGILEAPFYGGPFPEFAQDASEVLLSRGDIHHLPNGRWLMCQEGCIECNPCIVRKNPAAKWALKRIERLSSHNSERYDLHVRITFRGEDHSSGFDQGNWNPWPRSYEYVTTQPEEFWGSWMDKEDPWPTEKYPFSGPVDDLPVWHSPNEDLAEGSSTSTTVRSSEISYHAVSVAATQSSVSDNVHGNGTEKQPTPHFNVSDERHSAESSIQLILGTDNLGNKRLIHVVPVAFRSNLSTLNITEQDFTQSRYRHLFELIFDSLSSNKEFIEKFLRERTFTDDERNRTNVTSDQMERILRKNLSNLSPGDVESASSLRHLRSVLGLSKILPSHLEIQRVIHKRTRGYRRGPAQASKTLEERTDDVTGDLNPETSGESLLGGGENLAELRNDAGPKPWNRIDGGEFDEVSMTIDAPLNSESRHVPRDSEMFVITESPAIELARVVSGPTVSTNNTDSP